MGTGARPVTDSWPGPEPEAALVARLRRNLTQMYAAVLAATLVVTGIALYFTLQLLMLRGEVDRVTEHAAFLASPWAHGSQLQPGGFRGDCWSRRPPPAQSSRSPPPPPPGIADHLFFIACFDAGGQFLGSATMPPDAPSTVGPPESFLGPALVARAIATGKEWDFVDGGPEVGPMMRGAVAVRDATSGELLGVLQVGSRIPEPLRSLDLIRNVMLVVGGLAFLVTCGGGWLLAARALSPARLAIALQRAFVADASHELRAPLALLRANADVLLRERDQFPPEHAAMLEDIVVEADSMARLTSDLLTLARLEAGRLDVDRKPVDLAGVAAALARRIAALAAEKGVAVERRETPCAAALGDRQYLEQAGLVLLENAVKYTPGGGTVTLSTASSNGRVSLVVEDTGIGIPPEQVRRLGERFFRGDRSRSRNTAGAGLGLAIALRVAAAHGGTISIDSAVGKGTRAVLTLPAADALVASERAPTTR
jgi:signal transduction histidine kinase